MMIQSQLAAASARLAAGDASGAETLCRNVLAQAPGAAEAHLLMGIILSGRGEVRAGLEEFNRALASRPGFAPAMAQKARALDSIGRRSEAIEAAEAAGARAEDAYSLDTAGVVLTRAGLHEKAAGLYGRAVKAGGAPGYFYNYGAALQFLGRFDEARLAYRECITRAPNHAKAWAGLVQITRQTRDDNQIGQLTQLAKLAGQARDGETFHSLGHALAKAYEDLGDYPQSMEWLTRAKAPLKARYREAADIAMFDAAVRSLDISPAKGLVGAAPIFVCGMPRTGTTLVDRILSNHSLVSSAGELDDFPLALRHVSGSRAPGLLSAPLIEAGGKADAEDVGRDYMAHATARQPPKARFVDKLPLNFFVIPLILRALPDARVICLRRHPADAVLSNYRQEFAGSFTHLDYAFDLESTARYYVAFDRLMAALKARLPPDKFCQVWYEDIVSDLDGQVRRMLDFCGLGFEEACLRFQDNASPVATASAAQVRQPLYSSSVGRWRKYRPAIDPALHVLVDAGVMQASELASGERA
ncbi:MAG TPA: sulfotransferase [Hyphomonadaceae bacterium]|nr:sulfotransferase [Hyphomonadaceae bacterium]